LFLQVYLSPLRHILSPLRHQQILVKALISIPFDLSYIGSSDILGSREKHKTSKCRIPRWLHSSTRTNIKFQNIEFHDGCIPPPEPVQICTRQKRMSILFSQVPLQLLVNQRSHQGPVLQCSCSIANRLILIRRCPKAGSYR
jgi:hypothetical protein